MLEKIEPSYWVIPHNGVVSAGSECPKEWLGVARPLYSQEKVMEVLGNVEIPHK